jgi:hypothetical protein
MNPDNAPLVNKLTLLVLSLILVCLVLLVARAYRNPATGEPSAVAEQEVVSDVIEEIPPVETPAPARVPQPSRRVPTTNTARVSLPARPPPPVAGVASDAAASTQDHFTEVPIALVNLTESDRAGIPVVSGVTGNSRAGFPLGGRVTLTGTPKPEVEIPLTPSCGRINPNKVTTRHFVVSPDGGLANVLVYVQNASPGTREVEPPLLDQIGCMFEPYVLGVMTGAKFRIRNSDPELHNIHATPKSKDNREFNFGQVPGQVGELSFAKPELFVRLKCDVHPWMFAYVNVLPHPHFAITDTDGFFTLPIGLLAGDYTIHAVHLKAGELTQQTTLGAGKARRLHFQFSATPSAQPQGRFVRSN